MVAETILILMVQAVALRLCVQRGAVAQQTQPLGLQSWGLVVRLEAGSAPLNIAVVTVVRSSPPGEVLAAVVRADQAKMERLEPTVVMLAALAVAVMEEVARVPSAQERLVATEEIMRLQQEEGLAVALALRVTRGLPAEAAVVAVATPALTLPPLVVVVARGRNLMHHTGLAAEAAEAAVPGLALPAMLAQAAYTAAQAAEAAAALALEVALVVTARRDSS